MCGGSDAQVEHRSQEVFKNSSRGFEFRKWPLPRVAEQTANSGTLQWTPWMHRRPDEHLPFVCLRKGRNTTLHLNSADQLPAIRSAWVHVCLGPWTLGHVRLSCCLLCVLPTAALDCSLTHGCSALLFWKPRPLLLGCYNLPEQRLLERVRPWLSHSPAAVFATDQQCAVSSVHTTSLSGAIIKSTAANR